MEPNERAVIGGNLPPDPIAALHGKLSLDYRDLSERRDELVLASDRLPERIENDATAGRVGDHIRALDTLAKNADAARMAAKAPIVALEKAVDGFFAKIIDPLKKAKKRIQPMQAVYLDAKAAREAREREAEAARMRAEAQKRAEEAERAETEARAAAAALEEKRRAEERAFAAALEEQRKAEAAKKAEADARKRADEEAIAAAARETEEQNARAKAALELARKASVDEAAAAQRSEVADKSAAKAETQLDRAAAIERQATKLEDSARGKPADLARTRGDYGSVSTLQRRWVGVLESRRKLDLEKLREHLPEDALTQAIGSFVRAGGRALDGARIFEDTTAQTR